MFSAKTVLIKIKLAGDKIFGTICDELYWRYRHLLKDSNWADEYLSVKSVNHPHRKFLTDKIACQYPFNTVFEMGSASGPNLLVLAKKFPKANFYGTDISKRAVETGQRYFRKNDIGNIFLSQAKAEEAKEFKDKSIDIIFTDALLIYIGPDKINSVAKEIMRIAKKRVFLCEWHNNASSYFFDEHWVYNYISIFENFVSREKIKVTQLPENLWEGKWKKNGHIIEIEVE